MEGDSVTDASSNIANTKMKTLEMLTSADARRLAIARTGLLKPD